MFYWLEIHKICFPVPTVMGEPDHQAMLSSILINLFYYYAVSVLFLFYLFAYTFSLSLQDRLDSRQRSYCLDQESIDDK